MGLRVGRRTLLAGVAAAALGGCSRTGDSTLAARRVLFVGNSFTHYNGGLDELLEGLAPNVHARRVAPGGFTLQQHMANGDTLDALADPDGWDVVVLQEQSQLPVYEYGTFSDGLNRLAELARSAGAQPVALQTWARRDSPGVTTAALARAYASAGRSAGTAVAAAGAAFARATSVRPDLALSQDDGHPTEEGSYLAACVVLRTVYGPVGPNSFTGGLDPVVATTLQGAAAG
ncbi:hypothetical protein JQN72_06480 [Phycicoccus sp. CSK15P-2]|uniref:hypothetical protein n=1 Tax=Phycicoccus sp. CSK15P-2 TaxID=2807627 RepID=UPI00194F6401|nr:hypothetical protein [Phycicoccus sp. CSK15P-2]MBM6403889.1 hypothetical protein [Phycicoccus sp. CSK15P-2]